jgi:hypothetical protein
VGGDSVDETTAAGKGGIEDDATVEGGLEEAAEVKVEVDVEVEVSAVFVTPPEANL